MVNDLLLAGAFVVAYLCGAIPVSNIVARATKGVDLRSVGSGSVSPSNLYKVAGMWPTVLAGVFELSKGIVGPLLVGGGPTWRAALAGALAVAGHNWSPFLKGGGGRGLTTATGALAVVVWPAAAIMCGGLVAGALSRRIYLAMGAALLALLPAVTLIDGYPRAIACAVVVLPIGGKTAIVMYKRAKLKRADGEERPA